MRPRAVLGIDAAWTARNPSGVCLLAQQHLGWRCVALTASYEGFLGEGGNADTAAVVRRAASLLGDVPPDVIAVDMPLAQVPITGRRTADDAVSRAYGASWCSAHSPRVDRPGPVGERFHRDVARTGYRLATKDGGRHACALIEVYPHPAIVRMLGLERRLPYKVTRARSYWPEADSEERRALLLEAMHRLADGLSQRIQGMPDPLADVGSRPPLRRLKEAEDALDAAVCAWVGVCYLEGRAEPFGDETAAIWIPRD